MSSFRVRLLLAAVSVTGLCGINPQPHILHATDIGGRGDGETQPSAVLDAPERVNATAASFILSGDRSFDADGTVRQYRWTSIDATLGNLQANQTIETDTPTLAVTASPASPFNSGRYVVQLVVVDDAGDQSQPVLAELIVVDDVAPTAILDAPDRVAVTAPSITLSGDRSFDIGGTIQEYEWISLNGTLGNLLINQPIVTATAELTVTASPASPFLPGRYVVQLIVVDDSGNRSQPVVIALNVVDDEAPTAVITGPERVSVTAPSVTLSGAASSDVGGTVQRYRWSSPTGIGNVPANQVIETTTPTLTVTGPFAIGFRLVELVVVDDSGNQSLPTTFRVVFVDDVPPTIVVTSPIDGATYHVGQQVGATFSCGDVGSGIASCIGTVGSGSNIDTATPGHKTFTVVARDAAGNEVQRVVNYHVAFRVSVLYDQTKAVKSGSTIPIKIRLEDANGTDVSASNIVVTAIGVTLVSTTTTGEAEDSGNANPDSNFRYTSDGYIFNLKTTGLGTGTYLLSFRCGTDPTIHTAQFQVR